MFLFPVLPLYLKSLFRDYDNLEDFRIWFEPSSSANDKKGLYTWLEATSLSWPEMISLYKIL